MQMRNKEIRLSDREHEQLTDYKIENYDSTVPYGFVISQLIEGEE
jgi:hypothetical protein